MDSASIPPPSIPRPSGAEIRPPSVVYTFYSYKGGVGRSMALANVASLLAKWGRKVLILDWDIEAPGLERYFIGSQSDLPSNARALKDGVVDLIVKHRDGKKLDWRECVHSIRLPGASQPVSLITAGRAGPDYVRDVQGLDWEELFSEHRLGNHLEKLRNEWLAEHEFVLVDSRTGVSDVGGICTILLPDVLVCLFTSNTQSVEGVSDIVRRARAGQTQLAIDRPHLLAVPVAARDERNSASHRGPEAREWVQRYVDAFAPLLKDWLPEGVTAHDAFQKLYIPYIANWSFGERLPVIEEDRLEDAASISSSFGRLATLLDARLDWSKVSGKAEAHEYQTIKAEANALKEQVQAQAARASELEAEVRSKEAIVKRAARRGAWVKVGIAAAVAALLGSGWFLKKRDDDRELRARAETILAAASAAGDRRVQLILITELYGLPEPDGGGERLRFMIRHVFPSAILQAESRSSLQRVRLSADGTRVAAVYEDGRLVHWPSDGRGDPQVVRSREGRIFDVELHGDGSHMSLAVVEHDRETAKVVEFDGNVEKAIGSRSVAAPETIVDAEFVDAGAGMVVTVGSKQSAGKEHVLAWPTDDPPYLADPATRTAVDGSFTLYRDDDGWRQIRDDGEDLGRVDLGGAEPLAISTNGSVVAFDATKGRLVEFEWPLHSAGSKTSRDLSILEETMADARPDAVEFAGDHVLAFAPEYEQHFSKICIWSSWPRRFEDAGAIEPPRRWLPMFDVSANGKSFVTASPDGTLWVWPVTEPFLYSREPWYVLINIARFRTTATLTVDERMKLLNEPHEVAVQRHAEQERSFGRTPRRSGPLLDVGAKE